MRILLASHFDCSDPRAWSGIPCALTAALRQAGVEVEAVQVPKFAVPWWARWQRWRPLAQGYFTTTFRRSARLVERRAAEVKPDWVVGIHPDTVAYLPRGRRVAFIADATLWSIGELYPAFLRLPPARRADAEQMWQAALHRADLAVFSSDWACQSAAEVCPERREHFRTVPFGANFGELLPAAAIGEVLAQRQAAPCWRLLAVGVDWQRKGFDQAVALMEKLPQEQPWHLTLIGARPPEGFSASGRPITVLPFFDKSDPAQSAELRRHFIEAHALLVPSRADCCAVVLAEAASVALPAITTNVGGNATGLPPKARHRALPLEGWVEAAAQILTKWRQESASYAADAREAHHYAETVVNWPTFTARFLAELAVAERGLQR